MTDPTQAPAGPESLVQRIEHALESAGEAVSAEVKHLLHLDGAPAAAAPAPVPSVGVVATVEADAEKVATEAEALAKPVIAEVEKLAAPVVAEVKTIGTEAIAEAKTIEAKAVTETELLFHTDESNAVVTNKATGDVVMTYPLSQLEAETPPASTLTPAQVATALPPADIATAAGGVGTPATVTLAPADHPTLVSTSVAASGAVTKVYTDGSSATGTEGLPDHSPDQQTAVIASVQQGQLAASPPAQSGPKVALLQLPPIELAAARKLPEVTGCTPLGAEDVGGNERFILAFKDSDGGRTMLVVARPDGTLGKQAEG